MNDSPGSVELLSNRVDELEKRVYALEHPQEVVSTSVPAQSPPARTAASGEDSALQAANLFPTLGRAMLGIAGAYLLRALAALSAAPRAIVATTAIFYAFAWLIWASRVSKAHRLSSTIHAATSALILAPMLWETTLHFQTFSPIATAAVLCAFAALATALGWRRDSQHLLWVAYGAAAISALALSTATHQLLPFFYVLLLIAFACEIPRMLDHVRPMWWFVALSADAAIWGMIFIYAGPPDSRAEYPHLTSVALVLPPILLFAIYATSISVRAILYESTITVLEGIQAVIAFVLAVCAVLYLAPQIGTVSLGIACIILAAAGYAASFRYLRHLPAPRNFEVFAIWSAALLAAGAIWTLPHAAPIAIAISALTAYAIARRINILSLQLHGALFIILATAISSLPQFVFGALAGAAPNTPALSSIVIVVCITAAYALTTDRPDQGLPGQLLSFIPALVATSGLAALLISGLLSAARLVMALDVHHIAFLRTLVLSAIALFFAFAGSRLSRPALTRLAYIALTFLAAKLLYEDLRHGHMEFIAASIFLFAITLLAVPHLVRSRSSFRKASSALNTSNQAETGKHQPTHVA